MNMDMATRLADRRRAAGLSQEALAEKLGVTRQAVSKWERSESSPDTDNLIALANLYGVSLDDLLYADVEDAGAEDGAAAGDSSDGEGAEDAAADPASAAESDAREEFHIGLDGISVNDGADHVDISWRDGIHVVDGKKGDAVHVGWDGVRVNGQRCDTACTFHERFPRCGHGDERPAVARAWMRFPFPVLALLAYLLIGLATEMWLQGLFIVFTIPLYYMIGAFLSTRSVGTLVSGLYAIGAIAWFCYMAFMLDQPHPAWVLLLTIPLVCALAAWATQARRKHRKRAS